MKITKCWKDENNNVSTLENEDDAKAALATLKNCYNTTDCKYCTDCTGCTDCKYCTDCTGCTDCKYCTDCIDCIDCTGCTDCKYCTDIISM
jgi:hypothetical protein